MQKDITFKQNNVWRNNTYTGDWHFMVKEAGHVSPGTRGDQRPTVRTPAAA